MMGDLADAMSQSERGHELIHGRNGPAPKGKRPQPSPPPPKRPAGSLAELSRNIGIPEDELRAFFKKATKDAVEAVPTFVTSLQRIQAGENPLRVVAEIDDWCARKSFAETLIAMQEAAKRGKKT